MKRLLISYCLAIISINDPPSKKQAQIETHQSAPYILPTPFCYNRYQIFAVLAERCCFFCVFLPLFCGFRFKTVKFSGLHKAFTVFAYRIRAPPSEV